MISAYAELMLDSVAPEHPLQHNSGPGLGTTFKIYLPRVLQESSEASASKPVGKLYANGCETLLLVEDEATVRQATLEFLNLKGYIVLQAKNGEDAMNVSANYSERIDLMITAVIMPRMGGAKLAERLAVDRPFMKVLFVSGYKENAALRQGAIDGTTRCLQKPFSLKTLAGKIRETAGSGTTCRCLFGFRGIIPSCAAPV